jgi:hypothetical protein
MPTGLPVQIQTFAGVIFLGAFKKQGTAMRSLIVVSVLCLISTPAFACVFDNDCKTGTKCLDGMCSGGDVNSDDTDDNVPKRHATGKSCEYDSDCSEGSLCIKGSDLEGVCIGH